MLSDRDSRPCSSPSPSLLSCASRCRALVALSLRGSLPALPSFTGVCHCRPELSKRVRVRACGGKKFRGSCRRGKIGESRAAKVRECADRSTTRLFQSRSKGRLLQQHRYSCVVNEICPYCPLKLLNRKEQAYYRVNFIQQD